LTAIGNEQIHVAVVVIVGPSDSSVAIAEIIDACFERYVGEGVISVVFIKRVTNVRELR